MISIQDDKLIMDIEDTDMVVTLTYKEDKRRTSKYLNLITSVLLVSNEIPRFTKCRPQSLFNIRTSPIRGSMKPRS